ncbi:hypothetical protein DRO69_12570 [Candidatus Bathyarchaeota archaeon]|nr:MAG: hypothetical protein DRO69_12570 [Candidatus Bathyarchaeota archaeon]
MKFIYKPWNTVIIHEIAQFKVEDLAQLRVVRGQDRYIGRPINWADGVAFVYALMPSTEEVIKEQLEGKINILSLAFASMPTYKPFVTSKDGKAKVPVIDVSYNKFYKELAKWIKENFLKNE